MHPGIFHSRIRGNPITLEQKSTTTRKTGGLIVTLKGSVIFTAEPQRTLREIFFSFPLTPEEQAPSQRNMLCISRDKHSPGRRRTESQYIQEQIPVHYICSTLNSCMFSLCCPSCPVKSESYLTGVNSKEKIYSLCELCNSSEAGVEMGPSRTQGRLKGGN